MHRIDADGHTTNFFKESPAPPTQVDADWLNAVQEEIANAIEDVGAGGVTLVKGTNTQLASVIVSKATTQTISGAKTFTAATTIFSNDVSIGDDLNVGDDASVDGVVFANAGVEVIGNIFQVSGNANLGPTDVNGALDVTGALDVNGAGDIAGALVVGGTVTGAGASFTAVIGNTSGVSSQGQGSGYGINAIGGASGGGVRGEAQGTGTGVSGIGGASAGPGVSGIGGTDGPGVNGLGQGTGPGGSFQAINGYGVTAQADTSSPIRAALRLVPQDADPSSPQLGDIIVTSAGHSDGAGYLKLYNGAGWQKVGLQT